MSKANLSTSVANGIALADSAVQPGLDVTTAGVVPTKSPKGTVVIPENYGAKNDVVLFSDGSITAGSSTITSSIFTNARLPAGAGSKNIYITWAGSGTNVGSPSSALSTGAAITTIPRTSGAAIPKGPIIISSGSNAQLFVCTSNTLASAPIPVTSTVPNYAYPTSSTIKYGNTGLSTTVQVVGSGTATLGAPATETVQNVVGWFGTDDSASFRSARDALTAAGGGTILLNAINGTGYLLDSAPETTEGGYAIITLPTGSINANFTIEGFSGQGVGNIEEMSSADLNASLIYTTRQSDTYSSTYGAPSIIGGGTYEQQGSLWPVTGTVNLKNITFIKPENPAIGSFDAKLIANLTMTQVRSKTPVLMKNYGGGYGDVGQVPTNVNSFGFWLPGSLSSGTITLDAVEVFGEYMPYIHSSHATVKQAFSQFCAAVMGFCDMRSTGGHLVEIVKMGAFACINGITGWDPVNGIRSLYPGTAVYIHGGAINWELDGNQWTNQNSTLDLNSCIYGEIDSHAFASAFSVPVQTTQPGGCGLIIRDVSKLLYELSYDEQVISDAPLAYLPLGNALTPVGAGALSTSSAITSLPVSALSIPIPPGIVVTEYAGYYQQWITTGAAATATTIPVTAQTPNHAYPSASVVHQNFTMPDMSGSGHNALLIGQPVAGLAGPLASDGSLSLNAVYDQFVLLDTIGALGANMGTATIECWVKTSTATQGYMLSSVNSSTGTQFNVRFNTNNVSTSASGYTQIQLYDPGGTDHRNAHITAAIYDSHWHHIVIEPATSGAHSVWVDGRPVTVTMEATPGTLNTLTNFTNAMCVGAWNNTGTFGILNYSTCQVAKLAFYLSQLSQTRIQARWLTMLKQGLR